MEYIDSVNTWLREAGTNPHLRQILIEYPKGQFGMSMIELTRSGDRRFDQLAVDQDIIGW